MITCLNIISCYAQNIEVQLIDQVSFKGEKYKHFVGVDTQSNFYFTNNQEIIKTDQHQKWSYSSFELGFPSHISLLNPLEILVFYEQANTFVLLDRFLNETNRVSLNNLNTPQSAKFLTNAKNDEVWLVDNYDYKLKFINYINDLRSAVSINLSATVIDLQADFNNAYILMADTLQHFDNYGTLLQEMPLENEVQLLFGNRYLLLVATTGYTCYSSNLQELGSFTIPQNIESDSYFKDEKFYIFENGIIFTYKLKITKK